MHDGHKDLELGVFADAVTGSREREMRGRLGLPDTPETMSWRGWGAGENVLAALESSKAVAADCYVCK